jgi:hypothetical protein
LHRRARSASRPLQQIERQGERRFLRGGIVRLARRVAQGKVREQQARHAHVLDDVARAAQDDGGDAGSLQRTRGEAGGLVAHGAVRHQHRGVDAILDGTVAR